MAFCAVEPFPAARATDRDLRIKNVFAVDLFRRVGRYQIGCTYHMALEKIVRRCAARWRVTRVYWRRARAFDDLQTHVSEESGETTNCPSEHHARPRVQLRPVLHRLNFDLCVQPANYHTRRSLSPSYHITARRVLDLSKSDLTREQRQRASNNSKDTLSGTFFTDVA